MYSKRSACAEVLWHISLKVVSTSRVGKWLQWWLSLSLPTRCGCICIFYAQWNSATATLSPCHTWQCESQAQNKLGKMLLFMFWNYKNSLPLPYISHIDHCQKYNCCSYHCICRQWKSSFSMMQFSLWSPDLRRTLKWVCCWARSCVLSFVGNVFVCILVPKHIQFSSYSHCQPHSLDITIEEGVRCSV